MLSARFTAEIRTSFRALEHRNFRLYWTGQLISLVGTWMQSVAQGWLMHRLADDPFMLGLLGVAQFLPVLAISLFAGVLADRLDKRRLLLLTQSASLVQAAVVALLASAGLMTPWLLIALAFVFGTINAFDLPARASFVAEMVSGKDLSNAIALNSAAFNAARVVGPAVAGILVATLGEAGCFWINAVSYFAVLAGLARMDLARRDTSHMRGRSTLSTLKEGIRYAFGVPAIRNLLLLLGFTTGFGFQYMVLLPVYAKDILDAGPQGFGLLVSAFGLGSLLSALRMTRQLTRGDLRMNLLVGLVTAGLGMLGFAWSRIFGLTLVMGFACGFGLILYVASTNTLLQITTEDRFRGRVMSLYTLMFIGTAPLGALTAGWVAKRSGAPVATSLSAMVLLFGALWVAYRLRVLARREAGRLTEAAPIDKEG